MHPRQSLPSGAGRPVPASWGLRLEHRAAATAAQRAGLTLGDVPSGKASRHRRAHGCEGASPPEAPGTQPEQGAPGPGWSFTLPALKPPGQGRESSGAASRVISADPDTCRTVQTPTWAVTVTGRCPPGCLGITQMLGVFCSLGRASPRRGAVSGPRLAARDGRLQTHGQGRRAGGSFSSRDPV